MPGIEDHCFSKYEVGLQVLPQRSDGHLGVAEVFIRLGSKG